MRRGRCWRRRRLQHRSWLFAVSLRPPCPSRLRRGRFRPTSHLRRRAGFLSIGADGVKSRLLTWLALGWTVRFLHVLVATYYGQLAAEKRVRTPGEGPPPGGSVQAPGRRVGCELNAAVYALPAKAAPSTWEATAASPVTARREATRGASVLCRRHHVPVMVELE
jgi:hypothetical protein